MNNLIILFVISLLPTLLVSAAPAQVIIIPTGEVDASGDLTGQGLERAGALPEYISLTTNLTTFGLPVSVFAARPTALVGDSTQACLQTVGPTAQMLKLPIHSGYSKLQSEQIASFILNNPNYNHKNVLICWRPDQIQALASAFGISSPPTFPITQFDVAWAISFDTIPSLQILPQNLLASDVITSCGCGTVPFPSNTGYVTPDPILESPQVWRFESEPTLSPMKITVNTFNAGVSSDLILVAPYGFSTAAMYGQPGALIMDNNGNPIYFRPLSSPNLMNTDFRMQTYNGNSVLTFWQGTLASPPAYVNLPAASSELGSCYYILDPTYSVIKTVSAQNGYTSDIHEFLITPNNTALLLSTKPIPMDLTPYGGPQNGFVNDFAIQEVDLATNELLFFWSALDHIPLTDSFQPASSATSSNNVWDAYHGNSIGITEDVNEIIFSSRNTWTIYRINKSSSNIVWRLGGKQSSFTIQSGADFSWQHDARFLPTNIISMFDDNCCESETVPPGTPPAHGLVLQLDLGTMTANLVTSYYHNPNINVASQGNVQTLTNSNKFIGWGQAQYFSEFAAAGNTETNPALNLLYDASYPSTNYTYRAYKANWVGTPSYPPSLALIPSNGIVTVYASWNGSTETKFWQVFAGSDPTTLSLVATAPKSGFETAILAPSNGPCFQVKALNAGSTVIGVSDVVRLSWY